MAKLRILIIAGGTGGHVFPALAVAQELIARRIEVSWLGTRRGLEAKVVPAAGIAIDYIAINGLRGKGVTGWLLAPARIIIATWQAVRVVRRRSPSAVLGMGGFVAGPGGVAARLLGVALVIHEQNVIAGLTNRLLAHISTCVLEAFPATFHTSVGARTVGNPVRASITALAAPSARFAGRSGPIRLLVIGGSLGALAINHLIPQALALITAEQRPEVRHQCGDAHLESTQAAYTSAGVNAEILPFFDDMAAAYDWADLVLCRSGAMTVSEVASVGLAALFVPFPFAVDDHQSANARYLVKVDAARLLPQGELDAPGLAAVLDEFCCQPQTGRAHLLAMAERGHERGRPTALHDVAATLQNMAIGGE